MKALLDTNIIISREAGKISNQGIGSLFRWLDRANYSKYIHPVTVEEIKKNPNQETVKAFLAKMDSYEQIKFSSPLQEEVKKIMNEVDHNANDINDSLLLNEVFTERVDIMITEDRKIHKKAALLGVADKVFTIDSFLEKIFSEHPELVNYKVLNVRKKHFAEIDLNDHFFETLRLDYLGFDKWFQKKADEIAYVTVNKENGLILSFLYLKVEDATENYHDIVPAFDPKKRLKVGTFKVINNGLRLGERFMKIIFDNALAYKVDEIYVTIFDKREEQKRLIELMSQWGFHFWGKKGDELIYVRDFIPSFDIDKLRQTYPFISRKRGIFLVPIYDDYHTELLPDSILKTESPLDYIEDFPHRNAISKVYISRAIKPHAVKGDLLIFYRTGGMHKAVISTIGLVEEVIYNFNDEEDFVKQCRRASVFPEQELRSQWNYKKYNRPFIVRFMYVYSFPHRINMAKMIDLGILRGPDDAPRGFKPITQEQFKTILENTKSDESFIID